MKTIDLPEEVIESIVEIMLPDIIEFFSSESGKKEYEEWITKKSKK